MLRFPLGEAPLEIGRHHRCDVVIDDAEVADRHLLVMARGGTVVMLPLALAAAERARPRPLPLDQLIPLGRDHGLRRCEQTGAPDVAATLERATESLEHVATGKLSLLLGRGSEARRVALRDLPLSVGRAPDNDLVLVDRAASARHCRFEPTSRSVRLRDLDSRNGTLVNGVRVASAELHAGDVVRVGRSEMHVTRERAEPASSGARPIAVATVSRALMADAERYAALPWPALILGESGVGKEGLAELLHREGPRASGPLVALNAGGVPRELIESELFGHERGAFTGAAGARRGVFEQADGGTLFLDEIGELPAALQTRLLRVLETGEIRRVGAEEERRVEVRLVCATHRDLRGMVERGEFRQDLFFRIARLILMVPPLRQRAEDIAPLARHFLHEVSEVVGPRELAEDALERLRAHSWPGNARELRNVLSAAAAATSARRLEWGDVDQALRQLCPAAASCDTEQLRRVVAQHQGNYAAAARVLGMPRTTLRDRLRQASGDGS